MRCEDTPARIADDLAGTLLDAERRELEQHAETCRLCRDELQNASEMWRRLGTLTPAPADSEAMRRRFQALVDEEPGTDVKAPPHEKRARKPGLTWPGRHRLLAPLLQSAAAAVLLVVGIQVGRRSFPTTRSCPRAHSMSERQSPRTSPARRASRASSRRTARSLSPVSVFVERLAMRRSITSSST